MSPSPAAPRMLGQDALTDAISIYNVVITAHEVAVEGREREALGALARLADMLPAEIAGVERVLAAQRQAAEALDLAQRTPAPRLVCGAFMGVPNPHPHAPNSEQSNTSDQPSPSVA